MDAVKFWKERIRMCKSFGDVCSGCPLYNVCGVKPDDDSRVEETVEIVEKWSKEHPLKTRLSEFLKQYPDAPLHDNGLPCVPPCNLEKSYHERACHGPCDDCRKNYWLEEIK